MQEQCSGHRPVCTRCTARGLACEYSVRETKMRVPTRTRDNVLRGGTPHFEYAGNIMPTPAYRSRPGGGRTNAFAPSSHPYPRPETGFMKELGQNENPITHQSPLPQRLPVGYILRSIYPTSVSYNQSSMGAGLPSSALNALLSYDSAIYDPPSEQASHQLSDPPICDAQADYTALHANPTALPLQSFICQQSDFEIPRQVNVISYLSTY